MLAGGAAAAGGGSTGGEYGHGSVAIATATAIRRQSGHGGRIDLLLDQALRNLHCLSVTAGGGQAAAGTEQVSQSSAAVVSRDCRRHQAWHQTLEEGGNAEPATDEHTPSSAAVAAAAVAPLACR